MRFEFVSVVDHGLDRAAELLTRGFADYFVKIPFTAAALLQLARNDSVDLTTSIVVVADGAPVGAALIARRGWTSRIAGMAMLPEARGKGAGRELLRRARADAVQRGERAMVLEVIEQNEAAVRLYDGAGFKRVRRLVGFSASGVTASDAASFENVDPHDLASAAMAHAPADVPWQLSGETLAHLTPATEAFRRGDAWVALNNLSSATVTVRAVVTRPGALDEGAALLRALMTAHPGKEWRMSAIWPEELSGIFSGAGFTRTSLTQWQMRLSLTANGGQ